MLYVLNCKAHRYMPHMLLRQHSRWQSMLMYVVVATCVVLISWLFSAFVEIWRKTCLTSIENIISHFVVLVNWYPRDKNDSSFILSFRLTDHLTKIKKTLAIFRVLLPTFNLCIHMKHDHHKIIQTLSNRERHIQQSLAIACMRNLMLIYHTNPFIWQKAVWHYLCITCHVSTYCMSTLTCIFMSNMYLYITL